MLNKFFVSLAFLFLSNFAYSEEPNWQVLPISGGKVNSLAYAPDKSGHLLASGAQRVFKTNNGGNNWSDVLSSVKPVAIAFSPNTNGLAYLSGSYANAFYKTTNYGQNWVLVSSATIGELTSTKKNFKFDVALAVDPLNENTIYGASNEVFPPGDGGNEYPAILRTTNGGIDWSVMTASVFEEGVSTDAVITAFVQPASGKLIFSVNNGYGQNGGIFYSNDSGSSWHSATLNGVELSTRAINCLAIDPSNPGTIYAGGKVILKSTDYGQTWSPLSGYPSYPSWDSIYEIAVISTNRIIACDSNKCYESTDGGSSWGTGIAIDNTTSSSIRGPLLYSPSDNAIYIADGYSAGGIYKADTTNSLTGFTAVNNGLYNVEFLTLLHDSVNTNVIYGANQGDIFVSVDSGTSWATTYPTSDGKRSGAFAMITDTDGTIYAGIGKVLHKSSDFGTTWTNVYDFSLPNIGSIMALAFDPNNHNIMYMGTGTGEGGSVPDSGFYKGTYSGGSGGTWSWSRIDLDHNGQTFSRIAVSTSNPNIIYAVIQPKNDKESYLYKTTDGGQNWTKLSKPDSGGSIYSLTLDPDYDGTVYVADDGHVYKSIDSGNSWSAIFDDISKGSVKSFIITHKPGKVRALYMGLDDSVYMSTDEAKTWTLIGSGFNGVKALAEGSLYVGTSDGLYKAEIELPDQVLTAVETIGTGGGSVSFDSGKGEVKVNIPPSSFDNNITITVKLPDTPPSATKSVMGDISVKNIFVEINTGGIQPKKPVEIVMDYSSLGSIDEDKLVIARYDDVRGVWIPLKSYVDKINKKIRAYTDHFSVFGILSVTPASNISDLKVAPNPLRPSKGAGYTSMTFSNLPANVEVIIYSVSGVKIKKLTTDFSGIALWDGKNEDGESVASGVYFALIKNGSSTKTIKIGVQR